MVSERTWSGPGALFFFLVLRMCRNSGYVNFLDRKSGSCAGAVWSTSCSRGRVVGQSV